MIRLSTIRLTVGLALLLSAAAHAQTGEAFCAEASDALSPLRTLRALSLDLRGRLPSEDEMTSVEADGVDADGVDATVDAMVDEWLTTDAFAEQVVRHHRSLLWNNVGTIRLLQVNSNLQIL